MNLRLVVSSGVLISSFVAACAMGGPDDSIVEDSETLTSVCSSLAESSVARELCTRGKYFGWAVNEPVDVSDPLYAEVSIFTPEGGFWRVVQKKPYRALDLPDDGSADFLCDAATTAAGTCNATTAIFDFRRANALVDSATSLRKDLHWGAHIFWPWSGNPEWEGWTFAPADMRVYAFYLVRHVARRAELAAGDARPIRVSFNVTNEISCRYLNDQYQCGSDAMQARREVDGSYTMLRLSSRLTDPPFSNRINGANAIRAAFRGAYQGAVAAGDPTLRRTKFYVNDANLEVSTVRRSDSPEPSTRFYRRAAIRALIQMIQAEHPARPNIVWGVGNQSHLVDADVVLDPNTGECSGWSNSTEISWGPLGDPMNPAHVATNYPNRCWIESLEAVFTSFAPPYLPSPLRVLYTEVDVDRAGLYRQGLGLRLIGNEYVEASADDTEYPCVATSDPTVCVRTNPITGVGASFMSDSNAAHRRVWRRLGHTCAQHDQCEGIIVWGLEDRDSWLMDFIAPVDWAGPGARPQPGLVLCEQTDWECRAPLLFRDGIRQPSYRALRRGIME